MSRTLRFATPGRSLEVTIDNLVIAGWAGRDQEAVRHHIAELAALGVKPPRATPLYYRVAAALLTQEASLEVAGRTSTGEAEAVLIASDHGTLVTVGSDHTDRAAEAAGVTWSKQMCPKPLASEAWFLEEVVGRWDSLQLESRILRDGMWTPYQSGNLSSLRRPEELAAGFAGRLGLPNGTAMFLGTLGVSGQIAWADAFEARLFDPLENRSLVCRYVLRALPLAED